ncbi:unnamed protein product, partial [Callosobruchus maculatus]
RQPESKEETSQSVCGLSAITEWHDSTVFVFGSCCGPEVQYTYIKVSRIQGTRPYLPDEFLRGKKFSTKVDTYSFGIVLFEIVTALPPIFGSKKGENTLKDHIASYQGDIMELKDSRVAGYDDCFRQILNIGKHCIMKLPKERPEMRDVLIMLENIPLRP